VTEDTDVKLYVERVKITTDTSSNNAESKLGDGLVTGGYDSITFTYDQSRRYKSCTQ
jgi:hypothetical protein